jgi:hypothetical protein
MQLLFGESMKSRPLTDLTICPIVVSVGLFLISRQPVLSGLLNLFYPSGVLEKREDTVALLLVLYGVLFLALGVFGYITSLKISTIVSAVVHRLKNTPQALEKASAVFVDYHSGLGPIATWLFLALAIGIAVRSYFLSQPMRGDEAFTFLNYANQDIVSLFNYTAINNHVLHTILIKVSTLIWGASPASIRFPAFLAGSAAILSVFYLARLLEQNKNSGIFAAVGIAVIPYLILFSTNARGYSIVSLLTLIIAFFSFRFLSRLSRSDVVILAILSALGMLTIPIMVLPLSGIFCWVTCLLFINKVSLKNILYQFAIPYSVLTGIFTFVFYTPVILASNGVEPIIANKFVKPMSWSDFFHGLLPQFQSLLGQLSKDIPPLVLFVIFILFVFGIYCALRKRNWGILLIMPSLLLSAMLVILFQRQLPYARTWSYIIPFVLLVADSGFSNLFEYIPGRVKTLANPALVLAGLFFTVNLMSRNIISSYPDTSAFPEAPIAVQYLKPILKQDDDVRVTFTADWSVYFYFWYYGIPWPTAYQEHNVARTFFIVKKSRSSIQDMTDQPVTKLLDIGDLALYERIEKVRSRK